MKPGTRERRIKRRRGLKEFAQKLSENTPRSELWFYDLFKCYWIVSDQKNVPFGGYIPDILNKEYKYIIEIDGSIHNIPSIIAKDNKKNKRFHSLGYKVIRIKAYDMDSFNNGIKKLMKARGKHYRPAKIYTKEEIANYILKPRT